MSSHTFNKNNSKPIKNQKNTNENSKNSHQQGKITICATPIGNLGDISERLKETLQNADIIYAEDTRVTAKLLAHIGTKAPLKRLDENTIDARMNDVIAQAQAGKQLAYCSDAGMPGINDPGMQLVRAAQSFGIKTVVLPGPCAAINAYVASGVDAPTFYFGGFFPRKNSEKLAAVARMSTADFASIFYESPKRILKTLELLAAEMPQREISVCRELTKLHEEVITGEAAEVFAQLKARDCIQGEIVLVIGAASAKEIAAEYEVKSQQAKDLADVLISSGMHSSEVVQLLVDTFGIKKNDAYTICVNSKKSYATCHALM